jgi:hypothetical protein
MSQIFFSLAVTNRGAVRGRGRGQSRTSITNNTKPPFSIRLIHTYIIPIQVMDDQYSPWISGKYVPGSGDTFV